MGESIEKLRNPLSLIDDACTSQQPAIYRNSKLLNKKKSHIASCLFREDLYGVGAPCGSWSGEPISFP